MPTQTPPKRELFASTPRSPYPGVFVVILVAARGLRHIAACLLRSGALVPLMYIALRCSQANHTAPQSANLEPEKPLPGGGRRQERWRSKRHRLVRACRLLSSYFVNRESLIVNRYSRGFGRGFVAVGDRLFSITRAGVRVSARVASTLTRVKNPRLILGVLVALVVLTSLLGLKPQHTAAATADTVNFQAKLETNTGAIAPDGNYNVEFKLYSVSSGGSALWTEDYTYNGGSPDNRIRVVNGYLTVNLGSITPFPNINWDQNLYVTMNVGGTGTSASWDGEMSPRLKLTAVPYAFSAGNLASVNSVTGYKSTLSFQGATGGDQSFAIPDLTHAGSDTVCLLTLANCTGTGGGIAGGGVQNYVAKFDTSGGNHIGDSSIYDNGSFVGIGTTTNSGLLAIQGSSTSQTSIFVQGVASASSPTVVLKQASSQTGNLIEFQDSAGNVNGSINSSGNILSLGRVASSGTVSQGKIVLGDGTTDNYALTLHTGTLTANSDVTIPNSGGNDTVCLETLANCTGTGGGIAGAGTQNYIAKFDTVGGNHIGSSSLYDNGSFLGLNTTTNSGLFSVVGSSASQSSIFVQNASSATAPSIKVKAASSQTGDLFQLTDNTGAVLSGFTSGGNLYYANSSHKLTVNAATLTADQTITLPNESGTICLQNSANCGFVTSSTLNGYVQLGPASAQTDSSANVSIFINDTGGGNLLQLQSGGTTEFTVANNGATTIANALTVQSGGLSVSGGAGITGDTAVTGSVTATTSLQAPLIHSADIATASTNSSDLTIRSGNATGATSNSGNVIIDVGTATGTVGNVQLGTANAGSVTIGHSGITTTIGGDLNVSGNTTLAAGKNLTLSAGTGTVTQGYTTSANGSGATFNTTDNAGSGSVTVNSLGVNLTGHSTTGTNTLNGINFGNVTSIANNVFNGLNFGTGYSSLLTYNGTQLISGTGILQSAALSGTYSGALTFSNTTNTYSGATATLSGAIQGGSFSNTGGSFAVNSSGNVTAVLSATTGTTLVCQNASSVLSSCDSSFLNPTAGNFIQNQSASAQSANFKISGTGTAANFIATSTIGINNSSGANKLNINTAVTADSAAQILVATGADTNKGIVIQANSASQSANLLGLQDSSGNPLAYFDGGANLTLSAVPATSTTTKVNSNTLSFTGTYWNGSVSTANTYTIQNQVLSTTGTSNLVITPAGGGNQFVITNQGRVGIGGATSPGATLTVKSQTSGAVVAQFQGTSNQTADILQATTNGGGSAFSGINSSGGFYSNGTNNTFGNLTVPSGVASSTSGGTNFYYEVTAYNAAGETTASSEVHGSNAATNITWNPVPGASGYRVYRGTASGGEAGYVDLSISALNSAQAPNLNNAQSATLTGSNAPPTSTTGTGLTIQGWNGQTGDLLDIKNSSNNILTNFDSNGYIHVNRATAATDTIFTGRVSGDTNDRIQILANGTINFGSGSAATDNSISRNSGGALNLGSNVGVVIPSNLSVGSGSVTSGITLNATSDGDATVALSATANSATQTADLYQNRSHYGVVYSGFSINGGFYSNGANDQVLNLSVPTITTTGTGTSYYYEVSATNAAGETLPSAYVGMANNTSTISWTAVPGADRYKIYRSTTTSFGATSLLAYPVTATWQSCNPNGTCSYTDTGAATGAGQPLTSTTGTGLTIQGWSGQSGDAFTVKDSTGTSQLRVNSQGSLAIGTSPGANSARLNVATQGTGLVGVSIAGASGQTANLLQFQDSSSNILTNIDASGYIHINRAAAATDTIFTGRVTGDTNDRVQILANGTINFGSGSAATDTNLFRQAAGVLKTSSNFQVGGNTGLYLIGGNSTALLFGTGSDVEIQRAGAGVLQVLGNATATSTAFNVKALSSQSIDLFEIQDSNGNVQTSINSTGNQLTLGNATASGTSQGTLRLSDGTSDGFYSILQGSVITSNQTFTLPTTGGTLCTTTTCATGTTGSYIQNQSASAQSANFFIQSASTGSVGATIQGASGQTADIFDVLNSGNFKLLGVSANGELVHNSGATVRLGTNVQSAISGTIVAIGTSSATSVGETIKASASQTADTLQIQDVNGAILSGINANGGYYSNGAVNSFNALTIPSFTTTSTGTSYYYEISATNATGETLPSTSLGMANNTSALQWNQAAGATGYKIYRNTTNSFTSGSLLLTTITNGTTTSYTDTGSATTAGLPLTIPTTGAPLQVYDQNGTSRFKINEYGNATASQGMSVTGTASGGSCSIVVYTLCVKGAAPYVGEIVQGSSSQTGDLLQYQDSNGAVLSGVNANGQFYSNGTGAVFSNLAVPSGVTSSTSPGTSFYYEVTAYNAVGETVGSSEVNGTSSATTISWTQVAGATGYRIYRGTSSGGEAGYYQIANGTTTSLANANSVSLTGSSAPPTSTTGTGLTITGWSGQTGNLLNINSSSGSSLAYIDASGNARATSLTSNSSLRVGGGTFTSVTAGIKSNASGNVALVVQGNASGGADLLQFQDSSSNVLTNVDQYGYIHVNRAAAATDTIFTGRVAGDTNNRVQIQANGQINFGSGSAATDTYINRSSTGGVQVSGGLQTINGGSLRVAGNISNTQFAVTANSSTTLAAVVRGAASQTGDLLELQDSSGNVQTSINGSGNQLTLGNNTSSGTSAGSIRLADGTSDGFYGTLQLAGAIGSSQTYSLPTTGGTLCIQASSSCGFESTTGTDFIQNQTAATQTANFKINGTGVAGTLQAGTFDTASSVALAIGTTNASSIAIGHSGITTTITGAINLTGTVTNAISNSVSGAAEIHNATNSNTSSTAAQISGETINLTGTNNSNSGANSLIGVNFNNVSAATNNVFYGLQFGTGYNDILRYNGTQIISGTGVLQSAGLSGTYSNNLTLSGSGNSYSGANISLQANSGVAAIFQGASGQDIADFKTSGGSVGASIGAAGFLTVNGGTSNSSTGSNGSNFSFNTTNTNTSATQAVVNGQAISLTGTNNSNANGNVLNGIKFNNVTTATNNTFNGLYFGTGYDSLLNYNGTQLVSGTGKLQNAALDSTINYSNIQQLTNLSLSGNFTNNGSTLNTAMSISNLATGGNIGTAAATVDVATVFNVNQTTSGQTLTLPSPTVTTAGRVVYVSNVGTASFSIYGITAAPNTTQDFIWNGSQWTVNGSGTTGNYIINGTSQQTANFNIVANSGVAATIQGANGQDIIDFYTTAGLKKAYIGQGGNFYGTGLYTTFSSGTSANAATITLTNTNTSATAATTNGYTISLVGTNNTNANANVLNGITFAGVTAATNNTFTGLSFADNSYNNVLSVNGNQIINGSGVLQSAGLSGTYSNALTLSNSANAYTGANINIAATSGVAAVIQGAAGSDIMDVKNSGGVAQMWINASGQAFFANQLGIADSTFTAKLGISGSGTVAKFNATGSGDVLDLQSNGSNKVTFDSNGNQSTSANITITGSGNFDQSGSSGTFKTGTGAVSLNGNTSVASGSSFSVLGAATSLTGASAGSSTAVTVNSGAASNVGLVIQGVASQSADLIDVNANGVSNPLFSVGASGATTFRNSTNSTAALQIQNAAGNNIATFNTTTGATISLGHAGSGSQGYVGNAISATYYASATTTRSFSFVKSVPVGHTVIGSLAIASTSLPTITVTDSKGNIYTVDASVQSSTSVAVYTFSSNITSALTTSDTLNITLGTSVGRWAVDAEEFDNVLTPTPVDQTATASGSSTSMTVGPTGTTSQANEVVFGGFGYGASATSFTPSSGYTASTRLTTAGGSNDRSLSTEWKLVSSTGTQTATTSQSPTTTWGATLVTYKSNAPDGGAAASISLNDGTTNGYTSTIKFNGGLSGNRTIYLPDANGTICLDSGNCSAAGGYIVNGTSQQTANFNIAATGGVAATIQGASGQDIADFYTNGGSTKAVYIDNNGLLNTVAGVSSTRTIATTGSGYFSTITSSASSGSSTVSGYSATLAGTVTTGTNTLNGLNLNSVTARSNNTFNGIYLGSNFTNGIYAADTSTSSLLNVAGTSIINGSGVLQSAGLSGTYSNNLTLSGSGNSYSGANISLSASSGVAASITGASSQDIIDFYINGGSTPTVYVDNQGNIRTTAGILQNFTTASSVNAQNLTVKNSNTSATATTVDAVNVNLSGSANSNANANTTNGIYFQGASAVNNNTFNGLYFANTNYNSILNVAGTSIISGSGKLQNAGLDSTINYSNLQNVTNLTATGNLTVANTGYIATQRAADYSTTGTTNDVNLGSASLVRLTGGSTQTITGISGGVDGRILTIVNAANQAATLSNNNAGSAAANRITTGTGADISLPAGASVSLVYDAVASLWRVTSGVAATGGVGVNTIGAISATSNANGATITGTTLNLTAADGTNGGVVTNTTQTFAGAKTFAALLTGNAGITVSGGGISLQGNAASQLTTSSGSLTLDAAAALNLGNTNATSVVIGNTTNTTGITLNANVSIANGKNITFGTSGNFDQHSSSGTFQTGTGAVSINGDTTLAAGKSITFTAGAGTFDMHNSTGSFQTGTGNVTINGATTFASSVSINSGNIFTNSSATVYTALALGNLDYSGSGNSGAIGTAAATVDTHTSFTIAQTTAGQTFTIPSPTVTTAGRIIYIANTGTTNFTISGYVIGPGMGASYFWNGSSWVAATSNGGVNAVGALDGQTANANGVTIVGNAMYLQSASGTAPGLVNTTTQTFAGAKTFSGNITGQAGLSVSGGAISLSGNAASSVSTTSGLLTLQGAGGVSLSTTNAAASSGITIQTGNGTAGASGNVTIDTGTATTTAGTISLGTANASGITIGRSGITTNIQGNTQVALSATTGTTMVCQNASSYLSTCDATYLAPTATNFIQNQNSSTQTGNFIISGNGSAAAFYTSTIDTRSSVALNIGTSGAVVATAINLNQSTSLAAGKNLSFAAGSGSFDMHNATGTFQTGTGAVSLNGATTVSSNLTVSNAGSLYTQKGTDYASTGTQNDANLGSASLVRLTGASQLTLTGITGGADGRRLTLINAGSATDVVSNNNSGSAAANRITTGTGADINLPVGATIDLVYDGGASLWRVTSAGAVTGGYIQNQQTLQTANFFIQGSSGVTAKIEGVGTNDIVDFLGSGGSTLASIDQNGKITGVGLAAGTGQLTGSGGINISSGAISLTGNAASTLATSTGLLNLQGAGGVNLTTTNTTISNGITIQSGNSSAGTAGTVAIDTGTSSSGMSNISIGTANAGSITIGRSGITTNIQGNTQVALSATTGTTMVCQNASSYLSSCDSSFLNPTATNFIQNQNGSTQTGNFIISGTGSAATLLTSTLDTRSAVSLNIGTSGAPVATVINLNQNTAVASGKTFTVSGGATSLTGNSAGATTATTVITGNASNVGLVVQGASSQTADLLQVQDSTGANLFKVDAGGNQEILGSIDSPIGGFGVVGNLLAQTEAFDTTSAWTATNITVTADDPSSNPAPNGTTNADKLVSSASGTHTISQTYTTTNSGYYTFAVWVKTNSGTQPIQLRIDSTGGTPTTGTAASFTATTTWQRFKVTQNFTGSPTAITANLVITNNSATVVAWGAQMVNSAQTPAYVAVGISTYINTNNGIGLAVSAPSSTSAFLVGGPSIPLFTVDTTNSRVTVGTQGGCGGGQGKLCVNQTGNGSNLTTMNATLGLTNAAGTNYAQRITVNDTSSARATTNYALYIDASGTTNTSAVENGIYLNNPSLAGGGNLIQLQTASSDVFKITNGGAATLTGSLTQSGGAVSLTGNAASSLTTTSGNALTLTSGAAATWGTSAGNLTLDSAATLNLGTGTATSISIGGSNVSGNLNIDSGTGSTINVGSSALARTINVGNVAAQQTVTVGSTNGASSLVLQAGTGGLSVTTQGTGVLGIGNNAVAQTIQIGNTTGATSLALQAGTGGVSITGGGASSLTTTAGGLTIDTTTAAGQTIAIGNSAIAHTINIGTDSTTVQTVALGSTNASSVTTINGGGGINLSNNTTISGASTFTTGTGAVSLKGSTTISSGKNLTFTAGVGTLTQNYTISTGGTGATFNTVDNLASGSASVNSLGINLTGHSTTGTNTINGISFGNVTTIAGNVFNGLNFGTGYNNLLTSASATITAAGAFQGTSASFSGSNALTLGTSGGSGANGAIVFLGTGNTSTLTLQGPTTPNTGNFTLSIPAIASNATICTTDSVCGVGASNNYLTQVPTSNTANAAGANVISPTASSIIGLTVNGTTGATAAVALQVSQTQNAAGLAITNSGTNSAISITQSANPTSGNALIYANNSNASASGNLLDLRNNGTSKFTVDANGNVVALGSLTTGTTGQFSVGNTGNVSTSGSISGASFKVTPGTGVYDVASAGALNIGTGTATSIVMGSGSTTAITVQSSGGTTIQATTDSASAFTTTNSVGANILTVDTTNTGSGLNLAVNGGAENSGTFSSNWVAYGTSTVTQDNSTAAGGTYSVKAAVSSSNSGAKNNLGAALSTSTTYIVSFSAKSSTSFSDLTVTYWRNSTTADNSCSNYSSQTTSTTAWTKYTCTLTTSSTAGNSTAQLAIYQVASASRNIWIDNLSIVAQNSTGTQDSGLVRIGGPTSQGLTLFQLDSYAGTPFTGTNAALAGAMYFDTTSDKMQCYDGSNWGACGAAPNSNITLTPEYTGAVLHGTGIGTMTSDFCGNGGGISINTTLCASGEARNFYDWTSPQSTAQTYSIYVTYKLPSTFKAMTNGTTSLTARVDNTSNASITYNIYKSTGGAITACDSGTGTTMSVNTWTALSPTTDPSTCGFSANNYIIFQITVSSLSNANAYVENLNFSYSNQ